MQQLEPWVLFIRALISSLMIGLVGLTLVNIRANIKRLTFCALLFASAAVVVRAQGWAMTINVPIMVILLVMLIKKTGRLHYLQAIAGTILGMLVFSLLEILTTPVIFKLFNLELLNLMQNDYSLALLPLPQFILSLLIVFICLKYHYYLFDFYHWDLLFASSPNEKRVKTIMVLSSSMLFLLVVQLLFNMNIIYSLPRRFILNLHPETITMVRNTVMVMIFLLMIVLVQQLSVLLKKESEYMLQSAYIHNQDEIYTATRAEAHDRINHLQTLYGFVQLNNLEETRLYLEEMLGEMIISPQFIETGNPVLSSLFYIKSGLATAHGIQLEIKMNSRVENISIPAYELNRILGNLINNSFDSVLTLDKEYRQVQIIVEENDQYYQFRISNHGQIEIDLLSRIFARGFSTKTGQHQGLGLYIVKKLVDKNHGRLRVDNQDNNVVFTIHLPKSDAKAANYSPRQFGLDARQ